MAIPHQSLTAFVRIVTNPRISPTPVDTATAAQVARKWLAVPTVWMPTRGPQYGELFLGLVERYRLAGNLVSDAG